MARWKVEITGPADQLKELGQLLPTEYRVEVLNHKHLLVGEGFANLDDPEEVDRQASTILQAANTIGAWKLGWRKPLLVNTIKEYDEDGICIRSQAFCECSICALPRLQIKAAPTGSEGLEKTVELVRSNPDIEEALSYFLKEQPDFWKLYEVIRDDVGTDEDIVNMGWASPVDLDRFKGSINSKEVLGESARHARSKYPPPRKPMSLIELRTFAEQLLNHWIEGFLLLR